jgi:hypothetical protein
MRRTQTSRAMVRPQSRVNNSIGVDIFISSLSRGYRALFKDLSKKQASIMMSGYFYEVFPIPFQQSLNQFAVRTVQDSHQRDGIKWTDPILWSRPWLTPKPACGACAAMPFPAP